MPPRLNKRQPREQEELQALQDPANDAPEYQSESESPVAPSKPPLGGFAALMGDRDDDDDESAEKEEEGSHTGASKSKKVLQHLDSEMELRKFFGSKVISAAKGSSSSASTRQSVPTRSNLTRPQASWWPAQFREGLSVRQLTDEEVSEGLRRHLRQPLHGEKL
ncbi:hypothetical protein GSI_00173 [Ganoderma sinense ZZ0214-1]|uniref:Uncharacterized protein n=1 Tax=Ganoderma sinense ZZ0214-1 TaxID=1077348 RepID=A0A2G8SRV8_9APHY|nr:hypothetical protein GSI_00173 [Ganoderma sinense ZZ0214-1]